MKIDLHVFQLFQFDLICYQLFFLGSLSGSLSLQHIAVFVPSAFFTLTVVKHVVQLGKLLFKPVRDAYPSIAVQDATSVYYTEFYTEPLVGNDANLFYFWDKRNIEKQIQDELVAPLCAETIARVDSVALLAEFKNKIYTCLKENIANEKLSSSFLADKMAMSTRHFYRKFKEAFERTPTEIIKQYRIERAAALLREEDLSITSVIVEVGISSRSYFYKEFSAVYKMTPKVYKSLYCSKAEVEG